MKRKSMQNKADEFIRYKRDLGYKYRSQAYEIKSFAQFADIHAPGRPFTVKMALQWATIPNSSKAYHLSRLNNLSGFARFLIISDPKTELIPKAILGSGFHRTTPYIYSSEEVLRLMTTSAYARPRKINTYTFSTIIGLLSCTGLRIGELLALNDEDVDWSQKTLIVRGSKKLPMRLVPLHSSAIDHLKQYVKCRDCVFPNSTDDALFLSSRGMRYAYPTISMAWVHLRLKTGIGKNEKRLPRLHDFRHTFACNHLLNAYKENKNIDTAVHLLSVYLGHGSIKRTYWYLTGVPQLLELISSRVEKQINSIRKEAST